MRVDLRGTDVGVAQHLLQRAQVATAGEQVRGERVSQRVRTHSPREPSAAGVPLNDLVETLAREPAAASVQEHTRLLAQADEPRTPLVQVSAQRLDRL